MNKVLMLLSASLIISGCSSINKKLGIEDDNIIEESAEEVLKKNTGLSLDFTPGSPEE